MSKQYETRLGSISVRSDDGENRITGYAAVFNSLSDDLGGFRERIDRNAFDGVLGDDVRALVNHEPGLVIGRTRSDTLQLSVDDRGLYYRIDPPNTQYARDLLTCIKRGDITQSSFAFTVDKDSWEESDDGLMVRTINKVKQLFDISPVTFPAYPETVVAARALNLFREQRQQYEEFSRIALETRRRIVEVRL